MSYILSAIAVDLEQVLHAIGSEDERLAGALVETFADEFKQYDEMAADCTDDQMDEEVLTMRATLTQLVMGEEYIESLGFMYGYAVEFICRYFGEFLPNGEWSAMRTQWAERVDRELQEAGVAATIVSVVHHLMNRGIPGCV